VGDIAVSPNRFTDGFADRRGIHGTRLRNWFATALGYGSLGALDNGTSFLDIGFEHAMFNCGSDR
jgi:hypothetical protein